MKTLFLLALLFILVAFAFKEPNQSAWDFTRNVGTTLSNKVGPAYKNQFEKKPEQAVGGPANQDLRRFNDHLRQVEKIIEPISAERPKSTAKPNPKSKPKPKPAAETKTKIAENIKPVDSVAAKPVEDTLPPKITLKPAAALVPKPVLKVAQEDLSPPTAAGPKPPAYQPINLDELAEMGRRYDRASRLLSEIK